MKTTLSFAERGALLFAERRALSFAERGALGSTLGLGLALAAATSALAAGLPDVSAPPGFTATDRPGGGRVLSGRIAGATSGYTAFRGAMHAVRGYFDASPQLVGGVASKDGTVTIVIFDAALHRAPVRGLVIARYRAGSATVNYLFDEPSHLARTLPAMEAAVEPHGAGAPQRAAGSSLDARWLAAGSRSGSVGLTAASFPDRSASVGIADGFTPHPMYGGEFVATGSDGAFMRLDHQVAFVEPNVSGSITQALPRLAYTADVASVWTAGRALMLESRHAPAENLTVERALPSEQQANGTRSEILFGTADENGKHLAYMASVRTFPPTRGIWQMTFNVLWAPPDRIETDAPKMIAMVKSYRADRGVQRAEVDDFNAQFDRREQAFTQGQLNQMAAGRAANARAFAASMQQSDEAHTWISQSGQASINNIAGNVTVYTGAGRHQTIPIEDSDGFAPVPIDRYQKGVDY